MKLLKISRFWIIYLGIVFSICQNEDPRQNSTSSGEGILKRAIHYYPENLDPSKVYFGCEWEVCSQIYEGLLRYDKEKDELCPFLAYDWEVFHHEAGAGIRFFLRENVFFHDDPCFVDKNARRLSSYDILETFRNLARMNVSDPNRNLFSNKIIGFDADQPGTEIHMEGINIIDSFTVEFRLNVPCGSFLKLFTTPASYILSQKALCHYGDRISENPIGTGPFQLKKKNSMKGILLARNNEYWRKGTSGGSLPYLKGLEFRLLSTPSLALSEFYKGELDFVKISVKTYEKIFKRNVKAGRYTKLNRNENTKTRLFIFNFKKNTPFIRNHSLRLMIAKSFNRNSLSIGPSQQLAAPIYLDTVLSWYKENYATARSLFKKNEKELKDIEFIFITNFDSEINQTMKNSLNKLGLKNSELVIKENYYQSFQSYHPDLFWVSFSPSYPDAEDYYSLFYSKSSNNLSGYENYKYDSLYDESFVEQDPKIRRKLFVKMESILKQDVAAIYVNHGENFYYIQKKEIRGTETQYNTLDFTKTRMKK